MPYLVIGKIIIETELYSQETGIILSAVTMIISHPCLCLRREQSLALVFSSFPCLLRRCPFVCSCLNAVRPAAVCSPLCATDFVFCFVAPPSSSLCQNGVGIAHCNANGAIIGNGPFCIPFQLLHLLLHHSSILIQKCPSLEPPKLVAVVSGQFTKVILSSAARALAFASPS